MRHSAVTAFGGPALLFRNDDAPRGEIELPMRDNWILTEQRELLERPGNWMRPIRIVDDAPGGDLDPSSADESRQTGGDARSLRRILCPLDFSEGSRRALWYALHLARRHNARLTVLHVKPSEGSDSPIKYGETFIGEWSRDGHADLVVVNGPVVNAVVEHALERSAELIVIGPGRWPVDERLPLQSVTQCLLFSAPCPVLVVPPRAQDAGGPHHGRFSRVLCAVDFSQASLRAAMAALSVTGDDVRDVCLLHVIESATLRRLDGDRHAARAAADARLHEIRAKLAPRLPRDRRTTVEMVVAPAAGSPAQTILAEASRTASQLISMGAQSRSGFELLQSGSTTHRVAREASCPVVVARDGQFRT